jgi:Phospholipase_D-nuclease N-terminal
MGILELGGLFGLIVLALDIWALINVVQSGAPTGVKVVWVLLILFLPLLGFLGWLLFGPRKAA